MIYLFHQELLTVEGSKETLFDSLPVNRHPQDVRGALQKSNVILRKFSLRTAIDLQDPEGRIIALKNHIHRTPDTVLDEKLWRSKALFVFQMIGNDGLPCT